MYFLHNKAFKKFAQFIGLIIFISKIYQKKEKNLYMRILKSHPLLKLVNSYLIDASQPSTISYL